MALPALRRLRVMYPAAHACVVWLEGSLEPVHGEFDAVVANGKRRPVDTIRLAARGWDLVFVNVQGVFSVLSDLAAAVSRAPIRIGPRSPDDTRAAGIYTHPYVYRLDEHVTATNLRAVDSSAGSTPAAYPVKRLANRTPGRSRRIAVHPGVQRGYEIKQWPAGKFRELTEKLVSVRDTEIIVLAGPGEDAHAGRVAPGPGVRVCSTPTVTDLFREISACDLVVSGDTGPAHVAAALDVPVVVIFGPTNPRRVAPRFRRGSIVQCDLPCVPCFDGRGGCRYNKECLESITVGRVFEACVNLLGGK